MGKTLLNTFQKNSQAISAKDIVAVAHPLKATLFNDDGTQTDFKPVGIVNLILGDQSGGIIVVDNKTASKPMTQ